MRIIGTRFERGKVVVVCLMMEATDTHCFLYDLDLCVLYSRISMFGLVHFEHDRSEDVLGLC